MEISVLSMHRRLSVVSAGERLTLPIFPILAWTVDIGIGASMY